MASEINTIRRKEYGEHKLMYYPVLVIGAGESGIAVGCQLKQVLGFDQFTIVERRAAIGGVWYTNRYPGVAGDIPALCYSYSFAQKRNWTHLHPPGAEILDYLNATCDSFQIRSSIRLNTDVINVKWVEIDEEWEITLNHLVTGVGDLTTAQRAEKHAVDPAQVVVQTESVRAKILLSCVGALVEPKSFPDLPGMDNFRGQIVHSASWDPKVDVKGKDVIVIGTGSSGSQIVPALIRPEFGAKSVVQLMRSPPWVEPTMTAKGLAGWEKWMPRLCTNVPGFQRVMRKIVFTSMEAEFLAIFSPTDRARKNREKRADELLAYLHETVPEKYHEILTPDYEVFCKRRVIDAGWFHSLQDERVDLSTLPLTRINPHSITLGPGRHYPPESRTESHVSAAEQEVPADIIIFANGYEAGEWLHPIDVSGRNGQSLHSVWQQRGGPQAYLGSVMDGFPNFFIIHGPNTVTGHSSVILASEMMIQHALHFIPRILNGQIKTCEIKMEAEQKWTQDLQERLKQSVWMSGGCSSWYSRDGWNSTVYPRSQIDFALRCKHPRYNDWNATYSKQGLRRYRSRVGLRMPAATRSTKQSTPIMSEKPATQATTAAMIRAYTSGKSQGTLASASASTGSAKARESTPGIVPSESPGEAYGNKDVGPSSSTRSLSTTPGLELDMPSEQGTEDSHEFITTPDVQTPASTELTENNILNAKGGELAIRLAPYHHLRSHDAGKKLDPSRLDSAGGPLRMPGSYPGRADSIAESV